MTWRRRALSASGAAVAVVMLALFGAVGGAWYALEHPWVLCRAGERALGWPEGSLFLADLEWGFRRQVVLHDVQVTPPRQTAPVVSIGRVSASLPNPWDVARYRVVDLGEVDAERIAILQRQRRSPDQRPPPPPRPLALIASSVRLDRASYTALPDPPFNRVEVTGVSGEVSGVRWVPAARTFEGVGRASAGAMHLGNLEVTDVRVPWLVLAGDQLQLASSTFYYGRTQGYCEGRITQLDRRPAVEIDVRLQNSRIETAVEDALDRASPVMGWLNTELTIQAGGELARGDARFDGWVAVTDGYVFVGDDLKLIPKLLLDVAPWFHRDNGGWLSVGDLYGEATFGRGWVELERMERESNKHRILQAWGSLRDGRVDLTVRAVPRKPHKGGVGVRVRGPLRSTNIKLAKKGDLMDAPEIMVVD